MKIVCDDRIPFLKGVFEPYAEVQYLPGSRTGAAAVKDADALITRTRTRCDRALLEGSRVKIIASATIGYEHIDTAWCEADHTIWRCFSRFLAEKTFCGTMAVVSPLS